MNRGHIDFQSEPVNFDGLVAVYSPAELDLLRGMPLHEVAVIHQLKVTFGGELLDPEDHAGQLDVEAGLVPETQKGPALAPPKRRRKGEPLPGQSEMAIDAV